MPISKNVATGKVSKAKCFVSTCTNDGEPLFSQTEKSTRPSPDPEALGTPTPVDKRINSTLANKRSTAMTRYAEITRKERLDAALSLENAGDRAAVWIKQWDRGSRTVRLQILEAFLLFHSASNITRIEEDLGDSSILFFTRITTWLRLSYKLGVELRPLLCAIGLFVRGVRYMTCLLEIGGAQTLIDALSCSMSLDDRRETVLLLLYMANAGRVYREMLCDQGGVELLLQGMKGESVVEILSLLAALFVVLGEGSSGDSKMRVQTGLVKLLLDDTTSLEALLHAARTLRTFQMTYDRRHAEEMIRNGRDDDDGKVDIVGINNRDAFNSSRLLLEAFFRLVYHDDLRLRVEGAEMLTLMAKNINLTTPVLTRCLDVVDEDRIAIEMEDDMKQVMNVRRHQFSFGSIAVNIILINTRCASRMQLVLDIIARRRAHFTLLKYMRLLESGYTASVLDSCRALQILCRGADRQKNCSDTDAPVGVSLENAEKHILEAVGRALYNVLLYEEMTEDQSASILRAVKSAGNESMDVKEELEGFKLE